MEVRSRALALLGGSVALAWISVTLLAAPGPAAWVDLTGDAADAGVFFAVFSLSGAFGAIASGRAMDRFGRRPVLVVVHLAAAAGYATAAYGIARGSLSFFAAGIVLAAGALGGLGLTRLAAAELYPATERGRAIARVQVAATFGAIAGPLLLILSPGVASALGADVDLLVWLVPAPLFLASAFLVSRAQLAPAARGSAAQGSDEPIPRFRFLAGIVALVCAQAAMVTIMGVAGVSLRHAGHGAGTTGIVMALHFVGMFGLSLVVGRFVDRVGRRATILAGLGILAIGGAVSAFVAGPVGLGLGLLLVGLGWSFSYIGGSTILTDIIPPARRARTMGLVDFTIAILAALGSWTGGLWYAARGLEGLGLVAIAIVAIPAVLTFILREPRPARPAP